MTARIEVRSKAGMVDAAGDAVRAMASADLDIPVNEVRTVDAYTIDWDIGSLGVERAARELFADPVSQEWVVGTFLDGRYDWIVEVGFLPGVTDNVGSTSREAIADLLDVEPGEGDRVYSSRLYLIVGGLEEHEVARIASRLSNPLIQRVGWKRRADYERDGGMDLPLPRVSLAASDHVEVVDLDVPDEDLMRLSREGIPGPDGQRRGPLALDLDQMGAIRDYFRTEGRPPTDVELESLAQTWSEHCKHNIFAARIDDVDSIYRTYIKGATKRVREMKGGADSCLSVFVDNAGVVRFNRRWSVCYKVETHNSPSALDPYGGAVTGIVGVNRDPLGTGKGASLVMNMYGFCFANPFHADPLPTRDPEGRVPILHPKTVFEGVRKGVEDGGNKTGIPTPLGFITFDDRYMGKPLVFVGTVGLMPAHIDGEESHRKRARPGDLVVMAGGRVGKDGIHGATFSSESLHSGSPAGAVQIGDPITQKKLADAQLEAREMGLYSSITDCGAGGISCAVGEMARESGGCEVDLDRVPVKYPGIAPYEIWISESQERMTYAVPPEKLTDLMTLYRNRGVEATVVGRYTDSGRCVVRFEGRRVMDVDLDFLHDGVPRKQLESTWTPPLLSDPAMPEPEDLGATLVEMMGRLNVCSREYVVRQYDHEVQGGSVVKPLTGVRSDVHNDGVVIRPLLDSSEGLAFSTGILPWYGDIDTYGMAAACIDTAIRGAVAVGGDPDETWLLDNFCWCSSDEPERLGQLLRAARACYDVATGFGAPFISGKDSMFNDFKGHGPDGELVKISVPPTLLVSSMAKVPDVHQCVDCQAMQPGDILYVLGDTREEMGGSEYYALRTDEMARSPGAAGILPTVDPMASMPLYRALHRAMLKGLVASCASVSRGGLGVALARMAMAGELGIVGDLGRVGAQGVARMDRILFSESLGRFVVSVMPQRVEQFETEMFEVPIRAIGEVTPFDSVVLRGGSESAVVDVPWSELKRAYRATMDW